MLHRTLFKIRDPRTINISSFHEVIAWNFHDYQSRSSSEMGQQFRENIVFAVRAFDSKSLSRYERNWNDCNDDTSSTVTSNEYLKLFVTLVEVDESFKLLSVADIGSFVPTIHGFSIHTKRRPNTSNPKYFAYPFEYLLQIFFLNTFRCDH